MATTHNPNRKPFPRGYLLDWAASGTSVHPLERLAYEAFFKSRNPKGYAHPLGAQDVFLDNLGMLFKEQFPDKMYYERYANTVRYLGYCWELGRQQILARAPFATHYNSTVRRANAGEPRNLLRLMPDLDFGAWTDVTLRDLMGPGTERWIDAEDDASFRSMPETRGRRLWERWGGMGDNTAPSDGWGVFEEWPIDGLLPTGPDAPWGSSEETPAWGGIPLPPGYPMVVDRLRVLHPKECTPDLPLRVGRRASDIQGYQALMRDQGSLPTCAAHAVASALDVARCREFGARAQAPYFSAPWVHLVSGTIGDEGRSLGSAIGAVRRELPCTEALFPYNQSEIRQHRGGSGWRSAGRQAQAQELTARYGVPWVRELKVTEIAKIKAHLAAGWVVVVSTSVSKGFWSPGLLQYGLPLTALLGEVREPTGHAWCIVGYEHADGNQQWKYQGRFVAINSWGRGFPRLTKKGKGLALLPFALVLNEGIEAFALRFGGTRPSR